MLLSALGSASGTRCHPPRGRDAACSSSRDSRALISPRPCRENGPCGKKAGLRRVDVRNATSGAAAAGGSWKLEKEFMPIFIELADGIEGAMRRELGAGLSDLEVLLRLATQHHRPQHAFTCQAAHEMCVGNPQKRLNALAVLP